jgi:hypothetical protein
MCSPNQYSRSIDDPLGIARFQPWLSMKHPFSDATKYWTGKSITLRYEWTA